MIEIIRQWLTGVTCAALMAALADGLMPKGPVKQVGKLVCALVLLCAVLRPVLTLRVSGPGEFLDATWGQADVQRTRLEQHSGSLLKTLIERESAAYIVDKAANLGAVCQAQVECESGEGGVWLPSSARITGQLDNGQRGELTAAIQNELGIVPERQVYAGGE